MPFLPCEPFEPGFALLNLIFPPYLQNQLMQSLERSFPRQEVSQRELKESFKHIFLEDIGVCLYVRHK